jgi:Kef-type K+ transport system membrane component KefB
VYRGFVSFQSHKKIMTLLIVQITAVLLISLACGWVARKAGQARVIGEIIGGMLIGPSFFGRLAPHVSRVLFPPNSLGSFEVLSTVGLILFLFLIGSDLDYGHIRQQRLTATVASLMSIVLPFGLAIIVAPLLHHQFSSNDVGSTVFLLFLGISMSITAFPVLARILEERGLQSTPLGATALMCAAVDDVCAWLLLAIAMTLLPSAETSLPIFSRLIWLAVYLFAMHTIIRPLGRMIANRHASAPLSYELLGMILVVVFASAAATDAIGVHPLFGAFVAGLCFPRVKHWQTALRSRLNVIVSLVLLPLFFALTGMKTRLDLLSGVTIWVWTAVILVLAISGKVGGAVIAACWTGHTGKNALALGVLLNTRGLVELIVLNIAYNARVFSPTLFTMLIVMALVTTMTTVPCLNWLNVGSEDPFNQDRLVSEPLKVLTP